MNTGAMRDRVTFRKTTDGGRTYSSELLSCRAYINGVNGNEFFIANAGYEGALAVTISCRYQAALMDINPTVCRAYDQRGYEYELISPADDRQGKHKEVIFRARRYFIGGEDTEDTDDEG